MRDGRVDPALVDATQRLVHGYAWIETVVAALDGATGWAQRLADDGLCGEA